MTPIIAFLVLALQVSRPVPPTFQSDGWPEHDPDVRRWVTVTNGQASLRQAPWNGAPVLAEGEVDTKRVIEILRMRHVTVQAGMLKARTESAILGRILGSLDFLSHDHPSRGRVPVKTLRVAFGQSIEYLQPFGQPGRCLVRLDGSVLDLSPCPLGDKRFESIREPVLERWAMVRIDDVTGWIKVDDEKVKVLTLTR